MAVFVPLLVFKQGVIDLRSRMFQSTGFHHRYIYQNNIVENSQIINDHYLLDQTYKQLRPYQQIMG